jgi:hypothetical protein
MEVCKLYLRLALCAGGAADIFQAALDVPFGTVLGRFVVTPALELVREMLLFDDMPGVVMGVPVAAVIP